MKKLLNPLFLLGLLLASPAWASQQVVETIDKSYTIDGTPEIDVRNVDGPITITAHQGSDVKVKAIKEVHNATSDADAKRAADKVKVEIQQVGNRIEITVDYPKNIFSFGGGPYAIVRFEISAPKKSDVDAHAVDGSIEVTGLEGRLQLKTVDGDLEVRSCLGKISAHTVDGDLLLENVGGTMRHAPPTATCGWTVRFKCCRSRRPTATWSSVCSPARRWSGSGRWRAPMGTSV